MSEQPYVDVGRMVAELKAAGWVEVSIHRWRDPHGNLHTGPAGAYQTMKVIKAKEASWAVTVERNGESLVTLSSNGQSGKAYFTYDDEQTIRGAAEHLLAFIGPSKDQS